MKSLKEKIKVMQAADAGKDIEFFAHKVDGWNALLVKGDDINWSWNTLDYRIKPEPMEFWVNVYSSDPVNVYYDTKEEAEASGKRFNDYIKTIKVREVTE